MEQTSVINFPNEIPLVLIKDQRIFFSPGYVEQGEALFHTHGTDGCLQGSHYGTWVSNLASFKKAGSCVFKTLHKEGIH